MLTPLLLLSASALAPPVPVHDEAIVVTGTKATSKAIARYVDNITAAVDEQVPQFRDPICPASFGLPEAYNRVVEARLRDDAVRVGLQVAVEKCTPNVVVIVADEPLPLLKALQRKRPQMFAGLELPQLQAVLRTTEPIRTWQAIQPRGSDGRPFERVMFLESAGGPPRPISGNGAWYNPAASNSRVQQNTRLELVTSFVMIAANAVDGLTLTQIADYSAMRTFTTTRTPAALSGPTILGLFNEGGSKAGELTSWDIAYLRSLYRTSNGLSAHSQESAIAGAIQRELQRPPNE